MTDFTIESVLNMNTQAVNLLCRGECSEARSLLCSAFEKLVSGMTSVDFDQVMNEEDASCDDDDDSFSSSSTIEIFPVPSCDDNEQHLSTLAHAFSPNNAFEFYSKPFDISKNGIILGGGGNNNTSDQIQVAAAVIYNLGLTNQMLAITTGKSALLEKAVAHFHRALQLLDQCDTINVSTNLLLLAICNNCGYCRSYMFDAVSTRSFQESIKFLLDNLSCQSSKNEHVDYCSWETECDYFYSIALMCGSEITPVVPIAPAA